MAELLLTDGGKLDLVECGIEIKKLTSYPNFNDVGLLRFIQDIHDHGRAEMKEEAAKEACRWTDNKNLQHNLSAAIRGLKL